MKKLFLWAGGALVLVLVILALIVQFLDFNRYRSALSSLVEDKTGRSLSIGGDVRLELFPRPFLSFDKVSFTNAPWGSRPEMLKVAHLDLRLSLLSLLRGVPQVSAIRLRGADVLLETDSKGRGNWELGLEGEGSGFLPTVDAVRIEDLKLIWRNGISKTQRDLSLASVWVTPSESAPGRFRWELRGHLGGEGFMADIEATSIIRHFKGDPLLGGGRVSGPAGALEIKGSVQSLTGLEGIDLAVSANGDDLADLSQLLDEPLPSTGPWRLGLRLASNESGYTLDAIDARIGDSDLSGRIDLKKQAQRWRMEGLLRSEQLKLSDLGGGDGTDQDDRPGKVFSDAPFDLGGLQAIDARLAFAGGRIIWGVLEIGDAVADISLRDGTLSVEGLSAKLFDADVSGALTVDATQTPPSVEGKLGARKIDMGRFLSAVADSSFLGGPGDMIFEFRGRGGSLAALMASLSGELRLLVGEGTAQLRMAEDTSSVKRLLFGQLAAKGDDAVKMNCLAGTLDIQNGVANLAVLVIDTNHSTVRGGGQIDLRDETLDLAFKPQAKGISLSVAAPVLVTGKFSEPKSEVQKLAALRRIAGVASLFVYPPMALAGLGALGDRGKACLDIAAEGIDGKSAVQTKTE